MMDFVYGVCVAPYMNGKSSGGERRSGWCNWGMVCKIMLDGGCIADGTTCVEAEFFSSPFSASREWCFGARATGRSLVDTGRLPHHIASSRTVFQNIGNFQAIRIIAL